MNLYIKTKQVSADKIITLNDYPVHSQEVLETYFKKCQAKERMALVPVIDKNIVKKYLEEIVIKKLEEFEKTNSEVEYFMLDGSHRTTALTLIGQDIEIIIYEKDEDIKKARQLLDSGKILQNATLDYSLEENCKILNKHFIKKLYFMTVKQKTEKMITDKIISEYMIDFYNEL